MLVVQAPQDSPRRPREVVLDELRGQAGFLVAPPAPRLQEGAVGVVIDLGVDDDQLAQVARTGQGGRIRKALTFTDHCDWLSTRGRSSGMRGRWASCKPLHGRPAIHNRRGILECRTA